MQTFLNRQFFSYGGTWLILLQLFKIHFLGFAKSFSICCITRTILRLEKSYIHRTKLVDLLRLELRLLHCTYKILELLKKSLITCKTINNTFLKRIWPRPWLGVMVDFGFP